MKNRRLVICVYMLMIFIVGVSAQTVRNPALELYNQGRAAFSRDELLDSIRYYRRALEIAPKYSDAYRETARSFYYLDEYAEAEQNIKRALELAPHVTENQTLYGRILIVLGRIQEAESLFTSVLEREPYNSDARIGMGELSIARGDVIRARDFYQNSLEMRPGDRRVLISLAFIYQEQGRYNLAKDYVVAAVQADSQNPWVHYYAADFYLKQGDILNAERHAKNARVLSSDFYPVLELLSRIHVLNGEYEDALAILMQLDITELENPEIVLFTKAIAEYNSGQVDAAIRTLEYNLRRNPDDEMSRFLLEEILLYERPFSHPQRENHAGFHFARAQEYSQRNRNNSALYHYYRGLNLSPESVDGRRAYAGFFKDSGDYTRYLQQLKFLSENLGLQTVAIQDDLEIYEDLQRDSVSSNWEIDQFSMERENTKVAVFFNDANNLSVHSEAARILSRQLMDQMYTSRRIEYITAPGMDPFVFEAIGIADEPQAFSIARSGAADYFIVLNVRETENSIRLGASLFLARTGRKLLDFTVIRSGNNRFKDSIIELSSQIISNLPLSGSIVNRVFERGVINIGSYDSIQIGDRLLIIRPQDLELKSDSPGFRYRDSDILGEAAVSDTDFLLSQIDITSSGFFDNIGIGNKLILLPADEPTGDSAENSDGNIVETEPDSENTAPGNESDTPVFNMIFERIRRLR